MEYLVEFLLLGVGLAMDAFAVSICKGLAMRKVNKKQAVVIALFFGGLRIGYLLSSTIVVLIRLRTSTICKRKQ